MKRLRKGFSLIELSIVLIIIGLLMAAIMKGKDLIRSAEMKKFYNTFIKAWELAYTQYYDRTGMPLGAPLYVKENNENITIKDFVGADEIINEVDFVVRKGDTIENRAKEAGLELPSTGTSKSYVYKVSFTDAAPVDVWITFGSDPLRSGENRLICKGDDCQNTENITGKGDNRGNFMLMVNVPYDVAAQIDRIVDGYADGSKGSIICVGSYKNPKKPNEFNDVIDINKVKDYGNVTNCGGTLNLGNKDDKPYVTLMYKLGI